MREEKEEKMTGDSISDGTHNGNSAASPFIPLSPSVRRLLTMEGIDPRDVTPTGPRGRLTKGDVLSFLASGEQRLSTKTGTGENTVKTAFLEVDASSVLALQEEYNDRFLKQYGLPMSVTTFVVKAAANALNRSKAMGENASKQIALHVDEGNGTVTKQVPHPGNQRFAQLEQSLQQEQTSSDPSTFSISNSAVHGATLTTPTLGDGHRGALGVHAIEKRAVVVNEELTIRPMMYLALSFDNACVEERDAMAFLGDLKNQIENPQQILLEV
jgi:2-oxoglutarate dehydrogenase E2 component (dihydrolipoamide succinyltransferase)